MHRALLLALPSLWVAVPALAQTTQVGDPGQTSTQNLGADQTLSQSSSVPDAGTATSLADQSSLIVGASSQLIADAPGSTLVGNPGQVNGQTAATSQTIAGAGEATNSSAAVLGSFQTILGDGGIIVGSPGQSNTQGAKTAQATSGADTAANAATTVLGSTQLVALGGVIVGSTGQANAQSALTGQAIEQADTDDVYVADIIQLASNAATSVVSACQDVVTLACAS